MLLWRLASVLAPPLCACCGAVAGSSEPLCGRCRSGLRWLGDAWGRAGPLLVWAPLAYDGGARALVRALKFRGLLRAADAMAAQVVANAPPELLAHGRLVPVPLHPARERTRGYNQAERLAAAVGARAGLGVACCLERVGGRTTQVGRTRVQRLGGIAGSVRVRRGCEVPARAIVVDDVMTTGATLAACAQALLGAGALEVVGVTFARTLGR